MSFYCKTGSSSGAGPARLTSVSPLQGLAHVAAICWIGIVLSLTSAPAWYLPFLRATSLCVFPHLKNTSQMDLVFVPPSVSGPRLFI